MTLPQAHDIANAVPQLCAYGYWRELEQASVLLNDCLCMQCFVMRGPATNHSVSPEDLLR